MKEHNENSIPPAGKILADNSWRLPNFRTRTVLFEEAGQKLIRKYAAAEEAKPFIKNIAEIEKANSEYLKGQFDVLYGRLEDNYIEYEYLPYPSLHQKIAGELKQGSFEKADELLSLFIQKIQALNKVNTCPREFLKMVAPSTAENNRLQVDCLSQGVLDLTPKNILVDTNKWIVVDNEWSFDFPVPVIFIMFRAIRALAFALQPEIRKTASGANPVAGIFAGRFRTYYVPILWMKYITYYGISLWKMFRWETGFQRYVTGSTGTLAFRVRENPNIRTRFLLG